MSDGITDAERVNREEVERWRIKVKEQFTLELSTKELVEELSKRDVMKDFVPEKYCKMVGDKWIHGPARILVVRE